MNVDKHAERLVKRGTIDASTAARMTKFCKSLQLYDLLIGLGIAAIVFSLVIIVIANWEKIPVGAKIGVHATVNSIVAFTLFHFSRPGRERAFWFSPLMALLAFLTLTFILLMDQIYRTHWTVCMTLTFWLVITTPFLLGLAQNQHATRMRILSFLIGSVPYVGKFIGEKAHKYIGKYIGKWLPPINLPNMWPEEKIVKKLRPILLAAFLALPVVGVLALIAEEQASMPVSTTFRLPIVSFDPNAPISGDYLRFRFDGADAPDQKFHDYYISKDKDKREIDKVLSHPKGLSVTMQVQILDGRVLSYDMLCIDDLPWEEYLNTRQEQCRIRMGADCI